ncbi:hypothetical protein [Cytobacillus dafuensis]|uniref:Uncharacterized protein n=1 Tax=Cytobacillus dafuensis TaxID=1742359 RepID=A0A5B8Z1A8_CYTDA|nr:hypothetical protein [Cytobacillus dafuensis]QED46591.1 hypothetical protein FSZ17_04475 [Cytobacillus dafuensis]
MNSPEQNKKNLLEMKNFLCEMLFALSFIWIGTWFFLETYKWVVYVFMAGAVFLVFLFRFLKVSLKFLFLLSSIMLFIAFLVTVLFS